MLCSTINEMFQTCKVRVIYWRPRHFIRLQDVWLAVPGATKHTPGKSLRIGKSPFIWAKTKRVIWGRRAARFAGLSLAVRDTLRAAVITKSLAIYATD